MEVVGTAPGLYLLLLSFEGGLVDGFKGKAGEGLQVVEPGQQGRRNIALVVLDDLVDALG